MTNLALFVIAIAVICGSFVYSARIIRHNRPIARLTRRTRIKKRLYGSDGHSAW